MNPAPPVTRTFISTAPLGSPAHSCRRAMSPRYNTCGDHGRLPRRAGLRASVPEYLEPSVRNRPHFSAGCPDLGRSDADPFHGPRVSFVGDDVAKVDQTLREESDPRQHVADQLLRAQTECQTYDPCARK